MAGLNRRGWYYNKLASQAAFWLVLTWLVKVKIFMLQWTLSSQAIFFHQCINATAWRTGGQLSPSWADNTWFSIFLGSQPSWHKRVVLQILLRAILTNWPTGCKNKSITPSHTVFVSLSISYILVTSLRSHTVHTECVSTVLKTLTWHKSVFTRDLFLSFFYVWVISLVKSGTSLDFSWGFQKIRLKLTIVTQVWHKLCSDNNIDKIRHAPLLYSHFIKIKLFLNTTCRSQ